MMDFFITTLSFTVAILLASGLSVLVMMNKKTIKWYMKKVNKMTEELSDES